MPYDPKDYDASSVKLDRFMKAATDQIGDKYQFGAETRLDDPNPTAFDSSELVEWAANQAGMHDMPDGSWNQYRYLHEQGASVSVEEALHTKGALVFGFSSDPLDSTDRPARAYVGISLGNGKVLDVSERGGEVREMDPGDFYTYAAKIPDFHAVDDSMPPTVDYPGGIGPSHDDTPGALGRTQRTRAARRPAGARRAGRSQTSATRKTRRRSRTSATRTTTPRPIRARTSPANPTTATRTRAAPVDAPLDTSYDDTSFDSVG